MNAGDVLARVVDLYDRKGDLHYGDGVSQREHALQCGWAAERAGAPPAQIVAALLHDVGHMLHDLPEDVADRGIDTRHESLAAAWLSQFFGEEVCAPVRQHVAAKRYLVVAEPEYGRGLSPASRQSLALQGGPFAAPAAAEFLARPWAAEAIAVRRWDEEAKVEGLATPDFDHFRPSIEAALRRKN